PDRADRSPGDTSFSHSGQGTTSATAPHAPAGPAPPKSAAPPAAALHHPGHQAYSPDQQLSGGKELLADTLPATATGAATVSAGIGAVPRHRVAATAPAQPFQAVCGRYSAGAGGGQALHYRASHGGFTALPCRCQWGNNPCCGPGRWL